MYRVFMVDYLAAELQQNSRDFSRDTSRGLHRDRWSVEHRLGLPVTSTGSVDLWATVAETHRDVHVQWKAKKAPEPG